MGDGGEFYICVTPSNKNKINDKIIYPKKTTISPKNFRNSIFRSKEIKCKNEPEVDVYKTNVRETHIRNLKLLDLKHKSPKCCKQIYDMMVDRNKLKRLRSFNLSRPVRNLVFDLKLNPVTVCESKDSKLEEVKPNIIHEFHDISDSISFDDDEKYSVHMCESGSITECSGCSTLGGAIKQKIHVKPKPHWQDLLVESSIQKCHRRVYKIMDKYKGYAYAELKLKSTIE